MSEALIHHKPADREAWLKLRKEYVNATEGPKINGLSKYGSAADVLADKLGLAPEIEENTAMRVGKMVEEHIIGHILAETGARVAYIGLDFLSRGRAGCTPDLTVLNSHGHLVHYELKTTSHHWGGRIPKHYEGQVKHQLAVLELNDGWLVSYPIEDAERELEELMAGTWKLDPTRLVYQQISTTQSEREEILQACNDWMAKHIDLGLPLENTQAKANWDGTHFDPEMAARLKEIDGTIKMLEENLEAAKGMRDGLRQQAAEAMRDAKILQGYGYAWERIQVAGRKTVDYPKVLAALDRFLSEDALKAKAEATELYTKTTKSSERWTLKEA